ncbi:MAG: BsuPI-related putative proteinase inhibitor [Promethearchaeota archaeon]
MEKGTMIGIAALIIVIVATPPVAYILWRHLRSEPTFAPPVSLRVEIAANQHTAGEVMGVTFILTNTAERAIELWFPCSDLFDFLIRNAHGTIIYKWSQDHPCYLMYVSNITLGPYQSTQQTLNWTPSTPGTYTVTGSSSFGLFGEGYTLVVQPIPFVVID